MLVLLNFTKPAEGKRHIPAVTLSSLSLKATHLLQVLVTGLCHLTSRQKDTTKCLIHAINPKCWSYISPKEPELWRAGLYPSRGLQARVVGTDTGDNICVH